MIKEKRRENGLVCKDIVNESEGFPVQIPPGAWLGLGTQPCYNAPGDLWVENIQKKQ